MYCVNSGLTSQTFPIKRHFSARRIYYLIPIRDVTCGISTGMYTAWTNIILFIGSIVCAIIIIGTTRVWVTCIYAYTPVIVVVRTVPRLSLASLVTASIILLLFR